MGVAFKLGGEGRVNWSIVLSFFFFFVNLMQARVP